MDSGSTAVAAFRERIHGLVAALYGYHAQRLKLVTYEGGFGTHTGHNKCAQRLGLMTGVMLSLRSNNREGTSTVR